MNYFSLTLILLLLASCASIFGERKDFIYDDTIFEGVRKARVESVEDEHREHIFLVTKLHISNICLADKAVPKVKLQKSYPEDSDLKNRVMVRYQCITKNAGAERSIYEKLREDNCSSSKRKHPEVERLCFAAEEMIDSYQLEQ